MMRDAAQIHAMTGEAKLDAYNALCERVMPGMTIEARAAHMGYTRRSATAWRADPDKMPAIVLMYLQAWADRLDMEQALSPDALRALKDASEVILGLHDVFAGH